jgi:hypothetical protein
MTNSIQATPELKNTTGYLLLRGNLSLRDNSRLTPVSNPVIATTLQVAQLWPREKKRTREMVAPMICAVPKPSRSHAHRYDPLVVAAGTSTVR